MTTRERSYAAGVELGEMRPGELNEAAALLSLAYRDNPVARSFFGDDPDRRYTLNIGVQAFRIGSMDPPPIVARRGSELVGVCGFETPAGATPTLEAVERLFAGLEAGGVRKRAEEMIAGFAAGAPPGKHWHLGPVAVAPNQQGGGIGTLMVDAFCERVDADRGSAVLETDLEINVRLYQRYGFETQYIRPVIEVPIWFMLRAPRS